MNDETRTTLANDFRQAQRDAYDDPANPFYSLVHTTSIAIDHADYIVDWLCDRLFGGPVPLAYPADMLELCGIVAVKTSGGLGVQHDPEWKLREGERVFRLRSGAET